MEEVVRIAADWHKAGDESVLQVKPYVSPYPQHAAKMRPSRHIAAGHPLVGPQRDW
jgi:hypothetical protein